MNLKRGINLGGFLSQCIHTTEHYRDFILSSDIQKIAAAGFDHVRLPVDYEVFETEDGESKEDGFFKVEEVVNWCEKCGLNIVIDLHKAYGYDFNDVGKEGANDLFRSDELQERFLLLWRKIARRYARYNNVAFELLNEVVEKENAELWNQLIEKAVRAIREITADTPIIYGGIQWNSTKTICLLEKPVSDHIYYTFHFYEPFLFTHQKAYWVSAMDPKEDIAYPESMEYYSEKSQKLGDQGEVAPKAKAKIMGPEFLEELIKEAIESAERNGVPLYCGELGVIDRAPVEDTLRWFIDVDTVFRKYDIGYSVWNYREKDFGIFDKHYDAIRDELIKLWNNR